ncbi:MULTISPECIES: hypothetical protein [Halopseudomonas]|uniref:hypothetical protein n=1 Tax=Halopseudomonas TaxID=2901189 RepID=UPI0022B71BD0|nr:MULTISPECIES: hypothetical protein [Halopseudomonas]
MKRYASLQAAAVFLFSYIGSVICLHSVGREYSIIFLSVVVFLIFYLRSRRLGLLHYFGATCAALIFYAINFYYFKNLDVLVGPDEIRFNDGFYNYIYSPFEYVAWAVGSIVDSKIVFSSSYPVLGVILYPLFSVSGPYDPQLMVLFNLSLLLAVVCFGLSSGYRWSVLLVLLSPQILYHANIYAKDVLSLALCCFAVYLFYRKNIFLFMAVLVLATALRPYSGVVVFIYICVLNGYSKILLYAAFFSLAFVMLFSGAAGVVNSILISQYLIVSPNPFSFKVGLEGYSYLYIEAWILLVAYTVVSFFTLVSRAVREKYLMMVSGLVIYASVMALIGSYSSDFYGLEYKAGSLSGNIVRKKIMMMPYVYVFLGVILLDIFRRISLKFIARSNFRGYGRK